MLQGTGSTPIVTHACSTLENKMENKGKVIDEDTRSNSSFCVVHVVHRDTYKHIHRKKRKKMKGRKSPMVKKVWEMLFTLPSEKEIEY